MLSCLKQMSRMMATLSKRSTIYFDPDVHQAMKIKAAASNSSLSELIDEAARLLMSEDEEDLQAISDRVSEPSISYEALLKDLKQNGKI